MCASRLQPSARVIFSSDAPGTAMTQFTPRLDILPAGQRQLWDRLDTTPDHFVLYGGTARALRLGHRESIDFDFFSARSFNPLELLRTVPYLQGQTATQQDANTLSCDVATPAPRAYAVDPVGRHCRGKGHLRAPVRSRLHAAGTGLLCGLARSASRSDDVDAHSCRKVRIATGSADDACGSPHWRRCFTRNAMTELEAIAKRVNWYSEPARLVENVSLFLSQVMARGTANDIATVQRR